MPRPINADAQATQRKILSSASDLFAQRGRAGASVRDIARGAGVSLAMVHHYFGSKDGLYEACVESMLDELEQLAVKLPVELAGAGATPEAVLERAVRVGYRFARDHRGAVRLLQRSIIDAGEVDTRVRAGRMVPFLDAVSTTLGQLTGRPAAALRLPLQSGVFLVVRYAIANERELSDIAYGLALPSPPEQRSAESAGLALPSPPEQRSAESAVEEHLVAAILAMLGFPRAGGPQVPGP